MPAPEVSSYPLALTWSSSSRDKTRYPNSADYTIQLPVELYNVRELKFGSLEATSIPLRREALTRKFEIDEGQLIGAGVCAVTNLDLNQFGTTNAATSIETIYEMPCRNNSCSLAFSSTSSERPTTVTVTTKYGHGLTLASAAKVCVTLCCTRLLGAAQPIVDANGLVSNVAIVSANSFTISYVPVLLDVVGYSSHNGTLHCELLTSDDMKTMFNKVQSGLVSTEISINALRFVVSANLRLPSSANSIGSAIGMGGVVPVSTAKVPFISGMESMLRETVQRTNGVVLTAAAVFGYTNSSGVTSAVAVPGGTYAPAQIASVLKQLLSAAETTTVTVAVSVAEISGRYDDLLGSGFTITTTHNNTTRATDPRPTFSLHFSPFAQYGWAPTTSNASSQINSAARLLGFATGSSVVSTGGVIRSTEPSAYGSTTATGERRFKWQYNVTGDIVDRRVVVSARSIPTTEISCVPASTSLSVGVDQTVLTATPTSTPLAAHVGDVLLLSKNGGTGISSDSITTATASAEVVAMSATSLTLVTSTDNLSTLNGSPITSAPVTLLASVLDTPKMTIVPTGIGRALGYTTIQRPASFSNADTAWTLEDPSSSSILLSIVPDGSAEGSVENANHILTGPMSLHKCLTRITVRRSEEMLAITSSAISEAQASIARLNRVRVTFRNIDGSACDWSDTDHLITIVVRCEPARIASRIPLLS